MNIELSAILFPGQNLCVMRQSYNAVVVSREILTSGRNRKRAHKDQAPARLLGIVQASQILDPCKGLDHAIFPYNLYKPPLTLDIRYTHQQFGIITEPFGILYPLAYRDVGWLTESNEDQRMVAGQRLEVKSNL